MKNRINDRRRHRLASLLAFVLLASCTLVPTALMQRPRPTPPPARPSPTEQRDLPPARRREVKIDPRVLRVPPRAPVAFKPLEMIEPRTGRAVAPDTMLTLENGRQITAAKYYEQMNQLEAGLNKVGHSFRDQQKEVVTNEVVLNRERTLAQIRNMRSSRPSRGTAAQLEAISQAHREYVRTVNPYFGKRAPRGFSARVNSGLYQEKVGLYTLVKPSSPISFKVLERPDFVPGVGPVVGLGKDTESLPTPATYPGWAAGVNQATRIQVNARWPSVAFYVNYLGTLQGLKATAPLAPKYVWQVAKAGSGLDNFGPFAKVWATEFDNQEFLNWQTPPGLIGSGNVGFVNPQADINDPRRHLFVVDFNKLVGNPPDGQPVNYLVRVIPVNADGSIGGFPSRPVLVSYGTHPEFVTKPFKFPPPSPAKIPVNNIPLQNTPTSFGDPNVMSIKLDTWMQSNGSPGQQSASLGFDAGCSVYGHAFPLLNISAQAKLIPSQLNATGEEVISPGEATVGVIYLVGGFEIPCDTCKKSAPTAVHVTFDKSSSINESFTLSFPIGPIDVSATIGIKGEVGVGGSVYLSPSGQDPPFMISAGPHLSVSIFLEAGVGIGAGGYDVVQVGVDGHVNLISASFVVRFGLNHSGGGHYFGRVSDFKAFNGNLNGWAKAGICPFCKKWTTNLYSWEGYDLLASDPAKATLFEGSF